MIGNDVVDISLSRKESNWQRRGFMDKLFTIQEQQLIANHPDPEIMVWTLWSMKEAAYKIFNRQTGVRGFIPKQLVCTINNDNINTVTIYGNLYYSKTIIEDNCIYTVTTIEESKLDGIYELHDAVIIKDMNGLPYVIKQNSLQPISVSHHGNYYKVAAIK